MRLEDEVRYFFYVTNLGSESTSAAEVVRLANGRCNQENLIEQVKNGVGATRLPSISFHGNWAHMVIGALAWNLKVGGLTILVAESELTILFPNSLSTRSRIAKTSSGEEVRSKKYRGQCLALVYCFSLMIHMPIASTATEKTVIPHVCS
jgi:hypothetical protein